MTTPLQPDDVQARLGYARVRINDLLQLHGGDLPGADGHERQRLTQEVFSHLVGAIEVFAQLANERRNLGRSSEDVTIRKLATASWLPEGDALLARVKALYVNPRATPLNSDPYGEDGLTWRIWNYRHQVTHRRAKPFLIKLGLGGERRSPWRGFWWSTSLLSGLQRSTRPTDPSGHFLLDPLKPLSQTDQNENVSQQTVHVELDAMYALVEARLAAAIAAL